MKKGTQMVQNLNDETTAEANKTTHSSKNNDNGSEQQVEGNDQKRAHWSGMQLQGHQTHM